MSSQSLALSLVVPAYNERESLPQLLEGVVREVGKMGLTFEVVVVDDGSTDGSFEVIREWSGRHPELKGIRLARNFGQTAAMSAGLAMARGEVVGFLDADLQYDPADITPMLRKLEEGYDMVSGWRKNRQDAWLSRRLPSVVANALISRVTGVRLHDYGCTLKLYRCEFIQAVRLYGEMHRFAPAFVGFLGARIAEMEVRHRPRMRGVSKYGLGRTFKILLDLVTVKFMEAYLTKPIYFFGGWGVALGLSGAILAGATLYKKVALGIYVKDQPLFLVSIFFALVGFQLMALGILAEILVRVYYDIKGKQAYFVREVVGLDLDRFVRRI